MTAPAGLVVLAATVSLAVVAYGEAGSDGNSARSVGCVASLVQYTRYPGGDARLGGLPWIRGEPRATGLVGLIWYWPRSWHERRVRRARIFTGGVAPEGYSTKILWAFLANAARGRAGRQLVVRGERLDGPGTFQQSFAAISYAGQNGAPSYASIVNVPTAGCWRLRLTTGSLRASVVVQAVRAAERPSACTADDVQALVARFADALERGDPAAIDRVFAREPDFEWYSTDAPGERLLPIAADRESLVPYLLERHGHGERLRLHTVTFTGNVSSRARTYGNFTYAGTRSADDVKPTPYRGKGAALCYRERPDTIIVWSMARAAA